MARGYSLVAGHELLIAVASLVGEHGLYGMQASVVVAHGLSSTGLVVPRHGIEPLSPTLANSLPLSHQGNPVRYIWKKGDLSTI